MKLTEVNILDLLAEKFANKVVEQINQQEVAVAKEPKSDLPPLLDRKDLMKLFKVKSQVTFRKYLRSGKIPPCINPMERKSLWSRDIILNHIKNG